MATAQIALLATAVVTKNRMPSFITSLAFRILAEPDARAIPANQYGNSSAAVIGLVVDQLDGAYEGEEAPHD
eukprot:CAMPEP_0184409574 /NCGR_PEP_ID=MMETSP0738-20130409/4198_1 /TAXON_ID=385413 /ORGANISM="Thalassiosira miniscula, Strain CCMP1093" /LENGTH=71 /DNA_ID=CAMNT_0026767327 /DNA_START=96 /DNA_END=307 /DNA_ORIENTATION=-